MRWSKADDEALKKLYPLYMKRKISRERLVSIMGRTYYSCMHRANLLRLTNMKISTVDLKALKNMIKELHL